ERRAAPALHAALAAGAREARRRGATPASVVRVAKAALARERAFRRDYLVLVDEGTLLPPPRLGGRLRLLAAAWIGRTRLIDNMAVGL
ncbi:MAG: pantoate--beta-alanine ligase, partial [Elusimicrobia bacterium]|nr:pantoate--beta-alanine ligase [Elusimicrobiota bacterium]